MNTTCDAGGLYPTLNGAYPIVGHLPEMYRRFPDLCRRGERAHGPLFWIEGGPGARQLMCVDASALDVLRNPAVSTSFYAEGFGALLSNTLFAFDGPEHKRLRRLLAPAFSPARLKRTNVLQVVAETAAAHVSRWVSTPGPLAVPAATKELALEIIFRIIGVPAAELSAWRRHFTRYLLAGFPSNSRIKGPVHWVARRSRDWLDDRLGDVVRRVRRDGDDGTLVAAMALSHDDDGTQLDVELIVANLRLLVLAGHETTAAAVAWCVLHLARSKAAQRRAVDEACASADPIALCQDAGVLTFAEKQFREALRLYPAVHSVIRRVERPITLDAGAIPANTLLNVPLCHLLRDERTFPEPDRFLADRWTERPTPGGIHTAMFGGGPHFCLGYHLALAEGTLINLQLARALGRAKRHLQAIGTAAPIFLPLAHPPANASVCFVRG